MRIASFAMGPASETRHKTVIATQQFSPSADYSMISSASVRRVVATKGLDV